MSMRGAWSGFGFFLLATFLLSAPGLGSGVPLLQTRDGSLAHAESGTIWRVLEVSQTDIARLSSGERVRVDPCDPREIVGGTESDGKVVRRLGSSDYGNSMYKLKTTKVNRGSALPAPEWILPDFDDSAWSRRMAGLSGVYRALSLMCLRGKFRVDDPSKVGELSLSISFQGGLVAYLNGKEIGRANLPAGALTPDTPAEDYPPEAFRGPAGQLVPLKFTGGAATTNAVLLDLEKKRIRSLSLPVPVGLLRQGVNVLAIEVHRAPAAEDMFVQFDIPRGGAFLDNAIRTRYWWNRAAVESIALSVADAGSARPNIARPAGLQVWNACPFESLDMALYGDPNESLRPVRLIAPVNGMCSGKLMLSSTTAVGALEATASELIGRKGQTIPATAIVVRYPEAGHPDKRRMRFDALQATGNPALDWQPLWITVQVPKSAASGDYTARLQIRVDGKDVAEATLQLTVVGWPIPDPQRFTTHIGVVQSPETLSIKYNTPMWSEAHWSLIDKSFQLLATIGNKDVCLPLIRQTHFGNEHSMVRWIKQSDGTYRHDFRIVERYLDTAIRRLGKVPAVCVYCYEGLPSTGNVREKEDQALFSELYPATGEVKEAVGPGWGMPGSREFWKPVLEGIREILARRGMEDSLLIGIVADAAPKDAALSEIKSILPKAEWMVNSHWYRESLGRGENRVRVGYTAAAGGACGVFWDAEDSSGFCGWKNPNLILSFPREGPGGYAGPSMHQDTAPPSVYRICAEGTIFTGRATLSPVMNSPRIADMATKPDDRYTGLHGLGRLGGDFWPVLSGSGAGDAKLVCARYPRTDWGTLSVARVLPSLSAPGPSGPVSTVRMELLRQSLQEAEARVYIQEALLDDAKRGRLPGPLLERIRAGYRRPNPRPAPRFRILGRLVRPVSARSVLGR